MAYELNTVRLNNKVSQAWDKIEFPYNIQFCLEEAPPNSSSFKVGVRVGAEEDSEYRVAAKLVADMCILLAKYRPNDTHTLYLYPTAESIIAPTIQGIEVNKYLSSYVHGFTELNPPAIKAWLGIQGHFDVLNEDLNQKPITLADGVLSTDDEEKIVRAYGI